MMTESFESMLTGGHPNSLGRTIEVVEIIFAQPEKLEELYQCYFSDDEVVRLRVSNAMKRVAKENKTWLLPYVDRLINEISHIDQASTQWTLANLFQILENDLMPEQRATTIKIMQHNVATHTDWIVLNNSIQTLVDWADAGDQALKIWLIPQLKRHAQDKRKSVAKRSAKALLRLT